MREQICLEARKWLGTPYHHQARVKGVGVDCAQLVAGIGEELGIIPKGTAVPFNYSTEWNRHNREEQLLQNLESFGCKRTEDPQPGDIICFKYGRAIGHLGILVQDGFFIHAVTGHKVILNSTAEDEYLRRWLLTYTFPGIS